MYLSKKVLKVLEKTLTRTRHVVALYPSVQHNMFI